MQYFINIVKAEYKWKDYCISIVKAGNKSKVVDLNSIWVKMN